MKEKAAENMSLKSTPPLTFGELNKLSTLIILPNLIFQIWLSGWYNNALLNGWSKYVLGTW